MVSLTALAGPGSPPNIEKVAVFLEMEEETVKELLEGGRLNGALVSTLRRRGVAVTSSVKNAVQVFVRSLEPPRANESASAGEGSRPKADATATIMFTDVVGSTAMMQQLGDRVGRRLLMRHEEIVRDRTAAHSGSEVKGLGDGFMLTFPSSRLGVACAVDMQKALAAHTGERPQDAISVRIGISVGEPIHENEDIFGASVITAARITAVAGGGQVLVSKVAYVLASSSGEFALRPFGPVALKGLPGDHNLYEVIWGEATSEE